MASRFNCAVSFFSLLQALSFFGGALLLFYGNGLKINTLKLTSSLQTEINLFFRLRCSLLVVGGQFLLTLDDDIRWKPRQDIPVF